MGEANMCGVNHLDSDAHLPPRKRLLAGLKKQNCDLSSCSSSISSDFGNRLHHQLSCNSNGSHLSLEEIVDASRSAAIAAAKFAAASKITAEQKAEIAAKAVAAAKSALELVASFPEKEPLKARNLRKNKTKKNVPVKLLYENRETDEELAHRLHRAMNSSPRISKNSTSSGRKIHNHKKHKKMLISEQIRHDRSTEADDTDQRENMGKIVQKSSKYTKTNCAEMDGFLADGVAEASYSTNGRKRGRIKQKKLSLSQCHIRDRGNSKEESEPRGFPLVEEPKRNCTKKNVPLFPVEPSIEGEVSTQKYKKFNAPQCYTGSGILYSLCSNPTVNT